MVFCRNYGKRGRALACQTLHALYMSQFFPILFFYDVINLVFIIQCLTCKVAESIQ